MRNILVDARPLIALFNPRDKYHVHYENLVADYSESGLRLLTTWPCVVQATYLLGVPQRYQLLQWIELGGVIVYPFDSAQLPDIANWMRRYTEPGKTEMDFADATLYWLANSTGLREVMTVDHRDFSRYTLPDGSAFAIL